MKAKQGEVLQMNRARKNERVAARERGAVVSGTVQTSSYVKKHLKTVHPPEEEPSLLWGQKSETAERNVLTQRGKGVRLI